MNKSTPKRYTQSQLTKIFAEQSGKTVAELRSIWHNFTDTLSLRLNMSGYMFVVKELKILPHKFALSVPLTNKNLLQLERHFPGPYYYLSNANIFVVIDDQDAVWLQLQGGDLAAYLQNLETNT